MSEITGNGKILDGIRNSLVDALINIGHNCELNYYELLGMIEIVIRDIHHLQDAQTESEKNESK